MTKENVRTLVVDDEETVCFALRETLQRVGHVVTSVTSGEGALELLRETCFDAAVVDLNLGGHVDGLRVVEAIRWRWPDTAIVILTAHGSLESAITAIREGVDNYLLKPASPNQIRQAVGQALDDRSTGSKRNEGESPRVVRRGGFRVDLDRHLATREGQSLDLTPQELALLVHLMQNAHRVIEPAEIVQVLRGYDPDSTHEARQIVKWYVHRLRRRVEPDPSNPCHVVNVRGVGYRFVE